MFQSLIWRIRWTFDRKWREATRRRVLKAKHSADAPVLRGELVSKPFKMTALRRFVIDRLA